MTFLGIVAVLAASGWILVRVSRRFERRMYPAIWKIAALLLLIGGSLFGVWLLTRRYSVSETVRVVGYPFAIGGSEFIEGRWLGGLASPFGLLPCAADISFGIVIFLLPLWIAQLIFERRVTHQTTTD